MASSSRFAVALHIMIDLSLCETEVVKSSGEMALRVNTNPVVIRRLYGQLQEAGLIKTRAGKLGGACLAKSPRAISLWDIYQAVEDSALFAFNPNSPYKRCEVSCAMQGLLEPVFTSALKALRSELDDKQLESLVRKCRRLASGRARSTSK